MCDETTKFEQCDFVMPKDTALTFSNHCEASAVVYLPDSDPAILVIDKEGIIYKGERVKDAGEAYTAWMETMKLIKNGS